MNRNQLKDLVIYLLITYSVIVAYVILSRFWVALGTQLREVDYQIFIFVISEPNRRVQLPSVLPLSRATGSPGPSPTGVAQVRSC